MKQTDIIEFCRNYTGCLSHKLRNIKGTVLTLLMLFTIASLAALAVSGCSEKDRPKYQNDGPDPAVPGSLVLTPDSGVLAPGEELQISAQADYDDGTSQDVTEQARWEVSEAAVAEVDNGLVSALTPGKVTVTAAFEDFSAQAEITVTDAVPVSLILTPESGVLAPGETLQLSARAEYDDGTSQDVTEQAQWEVSDAAVAGVDNGLVSALTPGKATVSAAFGKFSAEAEITVTEAALVGLAITPESGVLAPGEELQLSARADYDDGTSQDVTEQARWEVSDTAVAEVGSGLVSALAPGSVTVTAAFGEFSAEAEITVTEAELVSVTLDKTELKLSASHSETLSAAANYADGTSVDINAEAEWTSSAADIAAVSTEDTEAGTTVTVQGLAPGTAVITAAYKGLTAQCKASVSDNPITALEIRPETAAIVPVGETIKLRAMATLSDQTEADVSSTAKWTSNKPEKAAVNKGTVTGIAEDDSVTITAQAGGCEASVNVKVGYNYIFFNSVSADVPDLEKYLGYTVKKVKHVEQDGEQERDSDYDYYIYKNGAEVTELVFPATFVYENEPYCISGLDKQALYYCVNLKSVKMPGKASYIGVSCFKGCTQLQSAEMPDIVNYIGEFAFADCPALTGLTLPGDITYILESTFENCAGLTSITVPSQVTSIDSKAFAGCGKLESIGLPDSLTSVGEEVFLDCEKLQSLTLPQNLESLGKNACKGCTSLTSAAVPAKITAVAEGLFADCQNLQTVELYAGTAEDPPVLASIGAGAFENCSKLESIAIPGLTVEGQYFGVKSIGERAFKGCESITELTVPYDVSPIGDEAFADVQHIYYYGTAEGQPWGANEMN